MNVKEIRETLNLTQAELAIALEVSRNYVCLLEAGKRVPSQKIINKLKLLANSDINKSTPNANKTIDLLDIATRLEKLEVDMAVLKKAFLK